MAGRPGTTGPARSRCPSGTLGAGTTVATRSPASAPRGFDASGSQGHHRRSARRRRVPPSAVVATAPVAEAVGSPATGIWSVLGEYRVSPQADEPHQPQPRAHRDGPPVQRPRGSPWSMPPVPARRATPCPDQPRRRARRGARRRATRGAAAATRWSPGARARRAAPRGCATRRWSARPNNYHFGVSYSDNEGADLAPRLHRGQHARLVRRDRGHRDRLPTPPARTSARSTSPTTGRRTRSAATGLHVIASRNFGRTCPRRGPEGRPAQRVPRRVAHLATSSRPPPTARRTWPATSST